LIGSFVFAADFKVVGHSRVVYTSNPVAIDQAGWMSTGELLYLSGGAGFQTA
jgi:hypothetical protein